MRLTLRTMLAYLDEILEPADAEELSKRIEESDFAGNLVHRIRGSMKRLRLSAPKLEGKGLGLDPNTVAEYLDNVLPADRVPDYEKVCLESDVHLAETASCHQILTLVLGEPADVSSGLRDRVYSLSTEDNQNDLGEPGPLTLEPLERERSEEVDSESFVEVQKAPADTDVPHVDAHGKPEVPDYLRAGRRRRLVPLLMVAATVFLLIAGGLFLFSPGDQPAGFSRLTALLSGPTQPSEVAPNDALGNPEDGQPEVADDQPNRELPVLDDTDNIPGDLSTDENNSVTLPTADLPAEEITPNENLDAPDAPEPTTDFDGSRRPLEGLDNVPLPDVVEGTDSEIPDLLGGNGPEDDLAPGDDEAVVPAGPSVLGQLVANEQQMIVSLYPDDQEWYRLPDSSDLFAGDRLTAFYTYRPAFKLAAGPAVTLIGPASVELNAPEGDEQDLQLNFDIGRVLIAADGTPDAQVSVNLAGHSGTLSLLNADGVVAIEIDRTRQLGVDPAQQPATLVVRLISVSGPLRWAPTDGLPVDIAANSVAIFAGQEAVQTESLPELPSWIQSPDVTAIDRLASAEILDKVVIGMSVTLRLDEIVENSRKIEARSMAARNLTQLGNPGRLISSFSAFRANKPSFDPSWLQKHLATLERELTRSPEAAATVRDAIKQIRGARADDFYRILWGYSPADLRNGGADALVGYLKDDAIDFRVLAILTLKGITGLPNRYYDPKAPGKAALRKWDEDLKAGRIVYSAPTTTKVAVP